MHWVIVRIVHSALQFDSTFHRSVQKLGLETLQIVLECLVDEIFHGPLYRLIESVFSKIRAIMHMVVNIALHSAVYVILYLAATFGSSSKQVFNSIPKENSQYKFQTFYASCFVCLVIGYCLPLIWCSVSQVHIIRQLGFLHCWHFRPIKILYREPKYTALASIRPSFIGEEACMSLKWLKCTGAHNAPQNGWNSSIRMIPKHVCVFALIDSSILFERNRIEMERTSKGRFPR